MDIIGELVKCAQAQPQRIVLPEGTEVRTIKAADRAVAQGIAKVTLLGDESEIVALEERFGLSNLKDATIINPATSERRMAYAEALYELRKSKGMTMEQALEKVADPFYYGCMMIKMGDADGELGGARNATARVLRPALQIIKTEPGITCISGAIIMFTNATEYGEEGVLVMGDVAVTPEPTAAQLAQIAVETARTSQAVAKFKEPRVAMLSFSTKGSATHEVCDKVIEATKIAQEACPGIAFDGELQADAALVPSVASLKSPGSIVAGRANVLVVPNLEVGNIAYKLVQRLGHAQAIGPILQGIARPVNDLSRGCSVDDVYKMIAITANQAIALKERGK